MKPERRRTGHIRRTKLDRRYFDRRQGEVDFLPDTAYAKTIDAENQTMMTKYYYVRNSKGFPVACLAYEVDAERVPAGSGPRYLKYGLSIYNPTDQFNRQIARSVAEGRMKKHGRSIRLDGQKTCQAMMLDLYELLSDPNSEEVFYHSFGTNKTSHLFNAVIDWFCTDTLDSLADK